MLALLAKVALLADLGSAALVASAAAGAASRIAIVWAPRFMAPARRDGLSAGAGRPPSVTAFLALGLGAMIAALLVGPNALTVLAAAGVAAATMGWAAQRCIGGQSGDVLGAMQVLGELAALAVLAV
jgi:adenosylcobinamide-GDP ribazoletransferase